MVPLLRGDGNCARNDAEAQDAGRLGVQQGKTTRQKDSASK